jgi:hypothetical protein
MPIRPENQPLYPPNWRAIAIAIRQGCAGDRCERCGVPNGAWRNHRTDIPHRRRTADATRRTRRTLGELLDVALEP